MFVRKKYDKDFDKVLAVLCDQQVLNDNVELLMSYGVYTEIEKETFKKILLGKTQSRLAGKVLIKIMRDFEGIINENKRLLRRYEELLNNINDAKEPYDYLFESGKILTVDISLTEYRILAAEENECIGKMIDFKCYMRKIKEIIKGYMLFIKYYLEHIYSDIEIKIIVKVYKLKSCNLFMFIHEM